MAEDKPKPRLLGWCGSGQHRECPTETVSGITCECPCEDHGADKDKWKAEVPEV